MDYYQGLGSSATDKGLNSKGKKECRGKHTSEFTAKDSVTPASVFPHTPTVGLRHLYKAAVPLVL
jgi:hypothetical protein